MREWVTRTVTNDRRQRRVVAVAAPAPNPDISGGAAKLQEWADNGIVHCSKTPVDNLVGPAQDQERHRSAGPASRRAVAHSCSGRRQQDREPPRRAGDAEQASGELDRILARIRVASGQDPRLCQAFRIALRA